MAAYIWPCRPDGAKERDGRGFNERGRSPFAVRDRGWLQLSSWVDGMGRGGLRCSIDLGVWVCAEA